MNSERNRLGVLVSLRSIVLGAALLLPCAAHAKGLADPGKAVPDSEFQEILIKTTLLSFNDANITGNYAVLFRPNSPNPSGISSTPSKLAVGFGKEFPRQTYRNRRYRQRTTGAGSGCRDQRRRRAGVAGGVQNHDRKNDWLRPQIYSTRTKPGETFGHQR